MLPKQPGRVPFHNSAEVALRGYRIGGDGHQDPKLESVTWSKVEYAEGNLHRGYRAAIIFIGSSFTPGVTFAYRRRGEAGPPTGNQDYLWRLPSIYFGDYLEVSNHDDDVEGPVSWRDYEFQVKNPEGQTSDWVSFAYPFDDELLNRIRRESLEQGQSLLRSGNAAGAVEPLRKAYVLSNRMLGIEHEETLHAQSAWEQARAEAALAKLRFRVGNRIVVISGPHAGKQGTVEQMLLNHVHAYVVKPSDGDQFQASDAEVRPA